MKILFLIMFIVNILNAEINFKFGANDDDNGKTMYIINKLKTKWEQFNLVETIPISKIERNIDKIYKKGDDFKHLWDTYVISDIMVKIFTILLIILFILFAIFFKKHKPMTITFYILSIITYPIINNIYKDIIKKNVRSSSLENLSIKQFKYSANIFIEGDLVNTGRYDFAHCFIDIYIYKKTDKSPKDYINRIKPLSIQHIDIDNLKQNAFKQFFITIFTVPKDVNFTTEIIHECK
jgi:hypothetical protein